MTIKSGWTELLKWVGWIDVIVSGVAAGLVIQAFFALGVIMLFCNIHDYVFDISIYIEKISRNQVKGTE